VRYVALATDYDGTIATEGVVPDDVIETIERVRIVVTDFRS
jgi:hydroxymethylpyrimidine pyrophosphatase-like HAD family hydrolase